MKRNSTTLFLVSPGAITPVPWVDNAPDFSAFTEPTLSVLQKAWDEFVNSGEELEIIPDPEPIPEPSVPQWDAFNVFMLSDQTFKGYRDVVRAVDGDLNAALFNAYSVISTNGISAFANVWTVWCTLSNITEEDKQMIADVAEGFNLPSDFVNTIKS